MSVTISGALDTAWANLTDANLTTIYTATRRTTVVFMAAKENAGTIQNLTLYRTDGTKIHYFRNAEAVTAKQRQTFDEVFVLKANDTIKAQSSDAAGKFDIAITYLVPDRL